MHQTRTRSSQSDLPRHQLRSDRRRHTSVSCREPNCDGACKLRETTRALGARCDRRRRAGTVSGVVCEEAGGGAEVAHGGGQRAADVGAGGEGAVVLVGGDAGEPVPHLSGNEPCQMYVLATSTCENIYDRNGAGRAGRPSLLNGTNDKVRTSRGQGLQLRRGVKLRRSPATDFGDKAGPGW